MVRGLAVACALGFITLIGAGGATVRALASGILGVAGYHLTYDSLSIGATHLSGKNVAIATNAGEPVLNVASIDARYSLFSIHSIDAQTPHVTLIRHRDGSWNVPIPKQSGSNRALPTLWATISNGSLDIYDQAQGVVAARHLAVRNINAQADLNDNGRTHYDATLAYMEAGRAYNVTGTGLVDKAACISAQRWTAAALPIAHIVDVGLNSPSFHISNGVLHGIDLTIIDNDLALNAQLTGAKLAIGGLRKPLRNVNGPIEIFSSGLLFPSMRASLANVPLSIHGVVYDFSSPMMRISLNGRGDVRDMRTAIAQLSNVPIAGPANLELLVEGPPSKSLMFIALRSPSVTFATSALTNVRSVIAFDGQQADVLDAHATYQTLALHLRGKAVVHAAPHALELVGGADSLAFPVHSTVVATSDNLRSIAARGVVFGKDHTSSVAGAFDVNGDGVGTVGPLRIATAPNGYLYVQASLDHRRDRVNVNALASNLRTGSTILSGRAAANYSGGTARVAAAATTGDAFAAVNGIVNGLHTNVPRYNLTGYLDAADLSHLVALVAPADAALIEGRAHATAVVRGSGTTPEIAGNITAPEGAINGLPYRNLNARFAGTPSTLSVDRGRVFVGSTGVTFAAQTSGATYHLDAITARANLADFNDFFDAGDMFGGTGSLSVAASGGQNSFATQGSVHLRNAMVRNIELGSTHAHWNSSGNTVAGAIAFNGINGNVTANGAVSTSGALSGVNVQARNVDIAPLLTLAGYSSAIAGRLSADALLNGAYPNLLGSLDLRSQRIVVANIPLEALHANIALNGRASHLRNLNVNVENATVTGQGRFGLSAGDPLNLAFDASSSDIGMFVRRLSGTDTALSGAVQTHLLILGTAQHPRLDDSFIGTNVAYDHLHMPRASGRVKADSRTIALTNLDATLSKGSVQITGSAPTAFRPNDAFHAHLVATGVDLADAAPLFPQGTTVQGQLNGRLDARGTINNPRLFGSMQLSNGRYASRFESVPITGASALLAFNGATVTLQNAHASAGRGTIDAHGVATVANLRDVGTASYVADVNAVNAQIDSPAYVKGTFNGNLHLAGGAGKPAALSGEIASDSARIPMTALVPSASASQATSFLPEIALNLAIVAGRDVRVQSPNVDIGARGQVKVMGDLRNPQLTGGFASTGGAVSFGRTFALESGGVRFDKSIIPTVHARATTFIDEPATDIALRVNGPATNMHLAFESAPQYSQEEILSMLALGGNRASPLTPGGEVLDLAEGQLNTLFTRNLLEPLSLAFGGALGLRNLQITNDMQHGLGVNAVKAFGKTANLVFADTFNEPRQESLSLQMHPSRGTRFDITAYTADRPALFETNLNPYAGAQTNGFGSYATIQPESGTSGFDVFWKRVFP